MIHFWKNLPRPIVGLSPMDGVTDAPFRLITAKHGRPDVIFTEFVPVEAITHNAVKVMSDLLYSEIERPVVAQVYGGDPESFYKVAHVICEMGFDGIDINMGCPAKNVVHHGCGASLIKDPERAKAIVRAVQRGIKDWNEGSTLECAGIPPAIINWVRNFYVRNNAATGPVTEAPQLFDSANSTSLLRVPAKPGLVAASPSAATRTNESRGSACWRKWGPRSAPPVRGIIPVSIKTRIGYSEDIITDWVRHLLEVEPAAISIHGRTLKQMYKGASDWDAIARAAEIIHQTPALVLGNGDIRSAADAVQKIRASAVDGVLIGRAAYGNPWIFKDVILRVRGDGAEESDDKTNALNVLLEHARHFEEICPDVKYVAMRKHFAWYARWIPALRHRKKELMQINSYAELVELVSRHSREGGNSDSGSPLTVEDTGRG